MSFISTLTHRGVYVAHVIRLQVENDLLQRSETFLNGEAHLMMFTADVCRHLINDKKTDLKAPSGVFH